MSATAHQMSATPPADAAGDGGGPATVASPVVDVLNGAAALIERDGWCQFLSFKTSGERCILGALWEAAGGGGQFYWAAKRSVAAVIDRPPTVWNDTQGRTQAEVVAALRTAAEQAS